MLNNHKEIKLSRGQINKLKCIELMGGKCSLCGEKNPIKLTFHHKNKEDKEHEMNLLLQRKFSSIIEEIKKCILLCSNCHREIHSQDIKPKSIIGKTFFDKSVKQSFLEYKKTTSCERCGYNKNVDALDFHHVSTDDKKFRLSRMHTNHKSINNELNKRIKKELDKCIVLCSNCHLIEHTKYKDENIFKSLDTLNRLNKIKIKAIIIDENEVVNQYNKLKNIKETSKIFNITYFQCRDILKKYNLIQKKKTLDDQQILNLHLKGLTNQKIAKLLDCHHVSVMRVLEKYGKTARKYIDYDLILKLYNDNKLLTNIQIAKIVGCCPTMVQPFLKKYRDQNK
jgi:hypothetical protein